MKMSLTHESGPMKGTTQTFDAERVRIGRGSANDVGFPAEATIVSRSQAEIFLHDGRYWLEDADSKAGTFVNGESVTVTQMLVDSDVIRFGMTGPSLRFRYQE